MGKPVLLADRTFDFRVKTGLREGSAEVFAEMGDSLLWIYGLKVRDGSSAPFDHLSAGNRRS